MYQLVFERAKSVCSAMVDLLFCFLYEREGLSIKLVVLIFKIFVEESVKYSQYYYSSIVFILYWMI